MTLPGTVLGSAAWGRGQNVGGDAKQRGPGWASGQRTELGGSCWDSAGGAQLEGTRKEGRVSFDLPASIIR